MMYIIYSRLIEHLSQQETDLAPYLEKTMSENHKHPWLAMAYKSETLSDAEREAASAYLSLSFKILKRMSVWLVLIWCWRLNILGN